MSGVKFIDKVLHEEEMFDMKFSQFCWNTGFWGMCQI